MIHLRQAWPAPASPRPIVIVGAGSIVRTAHLPAYQRLRFPVAGLFDIRGEVAAETGRLAGGLPVFTTMEAACAVPSAVFDVAVPGGAILDVLERLPRGAAVLIQKPIGETLADARRIGRVCHDRRFIAAANLQLRFSPNMMVLADLIAADRLGDLVDIDVRIIDRQPWEQWGFLKGAPRLEVLYHSIHYLDAIRWIAGEPLGVMCRAVAHPLLPAFRDTRSTIVLDYGDRIRCGLVLNHTHAWDATYRASTFTVEGTRGAARGTLGVNLDYPCGEPDALEISTGGSWENVPLRGSWFTEAFEGPMSNLQRFVAGEDRALVSPIDDAIKTMALVEACYTASAAGSTPIPVA